MLQQNNQEKLNEILVQQHEDLIESVYGAGFLKGIVGFLKIWKKSVKFLCLLFFLFLFIFVINVKISNNFPQFFLVFGKFFRIFVLSFSILLFFWKDSKFVKNPWLISQIYQLCLTGWYSFLYFITPFFASFVFVFLLSYFFQEMHQYVYFFLIGLIFFLFMYIGFILYKPLFLINKVACISEPLKNVFLYQVKNIPVKILEKSWIHSFFRISLIEFKLILIFHLFFLPSILLSYSMKIRSFVLGVSTVCVFFLIPLCLKRWKQKMPYLMHKISCSSMIFNFFTVSCLSICFTFAQIIAQIIPNSVMPNIHCNFLKSIVEIFNFGYIPVISVMRIPQSKIEILGIASHFVVFYIFIKIYRKIFDNRPDASV
ncbi:hypothetical protein P618_200366 [Holospora obtusa F1]|uniref:Uncharacterized protein n=1 Tax=Holospora obtusa F1 TaxID=1399147 RepID=W6TUN4_HOLOB|nr:hypothetical protein [Holospora obtusa]ETZ07437.1 hypothetical protein P618_200366 [Holospora obtusa F1]